MVLFRTMKNKIKTKSFQDKGQRINKNNKPSKQCINQNDNLLMTHIIMYLTQKLNIIYNTLLPFKVGQIYKVHQQILY